MSPPTDLAGPSVVEASGGFPRMPSYDSTLPIGLSFILAVTNVLLANGMPMSMEDIFTAMQAHHPLQVSRMKFGSFQRRLQKLGHQFIRIPNDTYWPSDYAQKYVRQQQQQLVAMNFSVSPDQFIRDICTIIMLHGKPIDRMELLYAYQKMHPECVWDSDILTRYLWSARVAIVRLRQDSQILYWFAEAPLPDMYVPAGVPSNTMKVVDPLLHYTVTGDECGCVICTEWRNQRDRLNTLESRVIGHQSSCECVACQDRNRARTAFNAASTRLDLWCEASFHAAKQEGPSDTRYGVRLMEWVHREITSPGKADGWWANRGPGIALRTWLHRFEVMCSGMIIGEGLASGATVAASGACGL